MGPTNYTLIELLAQERRRELREEHDRLRLAGFAPKSQRSGLRGSVASALVRWGLRLDAGAGERLLAPTLAPAAPKARPRP